MQTTQPWYLRAEVITELAFIADEQANGLEESGRDNVDTPLEVQFDEFMDGVNSRGKGTKTRQRKMTIEQAAAVLLVTVQKGHVELIAKDNDPHTIDVIKILPEAKRILATFLPKLRGYGDIPYDQQYRGAIALAKRHFFPKGKAPTKKELMALLLQSYQEKRELSLRRQTQPLPTKALGIQTSLGSIGVSSYAGIASGESAPGVRPALYPDTVETSSQSSSQSRIKLPNNDIVVDVESTSVASGVGLDLDDDSHGMVSEPETEPARLIACTPVAPRSFNPYMTPISNPRHVDHTAAEPSSLNASPTPAIDSNSEIASNEDDGLPDDGIGELLQATATTRGRLNYYYDKFKAACRKITFLEGQKEDIQREFKLTKRKLDETEKWLREANADRGRLNEWVNTLLGRVETIYGQLGLMRGMTGPEAISNEEWTVYDPEFQGSFDPNSI
ncbi:hypothetical protein J3R82DRAFT_2492 [Butyriboletus roseoflavus]|nr:hypothetical protein J3R82DRAFT_2492 [Butyriboletus roseoflavus]